MSLMCGTPARPASPAGGSILVTSAPRSRRVLVQWGPASTRVKSITRSPCSGASISVPLEHGRAGAGGGEGGEPAFLVAAGPHLVVGLDLAGIRARDPVAGRKIGQRLDPAQRDGGPRRKLARPRHRRCRQLAFRNNA